MNGRMHPDGCLVIYCISCFQLLQFPKNNLGKKWAAGRTTVMVLKLATCIFITFTFIAFAFIFSRVSYFVITRHINNLLSEFSSEPRLHRAKRHQQYSNYIHKSDLTFFYLSFHLSDLFFFFVLSL